MYNCIRIHGNRQGSSSRSVGEACFTTASLQPRLINAWLDNKSLLDLRLTKTRHTTKNYDFQLPTMYSFSGSGAALAFAWDQLIGHRKDGDQIPGGKFDIKN